jgi:hypothetical protein
VVVREGERERERGGERKEHNRSCLDLDLLFSLHFLSLITVYDIPFTAGRQTRTAKTKQKKQKKGGEKRRSLSIFSDIHITLTAVKSLQSSVLSSQKDSL